MNIDDFTPMGWAKDYFLTDEIVAALDSTEGRIIFIQFLYRDTEVILLKETMIIRLL